MNQIKNKIIVLCGFSGCGKDTILNNLTATLNINPLVSHTTRPIRKNETNGKDYHFISKDEFLQMKNNNDFIETREYHTLLNNVSDVWYYGLSKKSIDLSKKTYITVLDIQGLNQLKEYFPNEIISIFIDVDEHIRKERAMSRGSFDETEWNRRYKDDVEKFSDYNKYVDFVVKNEKLETCKNEILEFLKIQNLNFNTKYKNLRERW